MMEFVALLTKEKWTFFELYTVYINKKKLGKLSLHTYLLTCLNKDTSVLLKVINIWTSFYVKYNKNCMPNSIYVYILPHTCWKYPDRAWISLQGMYQYL